MSDEISRLILSVESQQVGEADKKLKQLTRTSQTTEKATGQLTATWKKLTGMMAGLVGIGTAISGLNKLREVATRFESLEAQLKTATGSAENASVAFDAIQDFATATPYDLAQATEAFISLVNLGLTPSERAMTSYGNTASAMGKDLATMVRAVAQATTGEYEVLKQFGVKARSEADGVAFTFQGVTTKVAKNAKEIEKYFIELGEAKFAGAMSDRMQTLEGKVSNLGDAWDVLFATIGEAGAGDVMKRVIEGATDAISELTAQIASGQLQEAFGALVQKFDSFGTAASDAFTFISETWSNAMKYFGADGDSAVDWVIKAFTQLPENVTAVVKGIGATMGLLVEYAVATGKGVYDAIVAYLDYTYASAKNLGALLKDAVLGNASAAFVDFYVKQSAESEKFAQSIVTSWKAATAAIDNATDAWGGVVTEIMDERDVSLASYDARIQKSKALRAAYDEEIAKRREAAKGTDRLEKFAVGGKSPTAEFQRLRESLMLEEALVEQSYQKRLDIIRANTEEGSALRLELEQQLNERMALERASAQQSHAERLQQQYLVEQDLLQEALNKREITETEFQERSRANWASYQSGVSSISVAGARMIATQNLQTYQNVLGMAGDISAQLSALVSESNGASKAMFIASKAIAIAQAIVNTELAATEALKMGPIMGISAATVVRAMGYASVGLIAAQSVMDYSGSYENGGIVPGTSYSGDNLNVRVNSGEMILNRAQQSQLWQAANGGGRSGNGGGTTVNIINQAGVAISQEQRTNEDGSTDINILVRAVENSLSQNVAAGRGTLGKTLGLTYGLKRRAA